ncbi:MAG: peptidyl-prolyl cis-trans isomerase [Sedimentisphaerales bacterium]|nr:peptidyl-prolyl cis-trans isomerase [Sedimentisphaerales bacterium]
MKHAKRNIAIILVGLGCLAALLGSGCSSPSRQEPPDGSSSMAEHLRRDDLTDRTVVARVNGHDIVRGEVISIVLQGRGKPVLDSMVALQIVRQAAARRGIQPTEDLYRQQMDRILEDMAPGKTHAEQTALLDYLIESRGLTRPEFDLLVQRQVLLRQMVDPRVEVTEADLQAEYERQFGRKVTVRLLAVRSLRQIDQANRRLAAGEDFAALVRDLSQEERTLNQDGLLGPISAADDQVPPELLQAALALETVGQRSAVVRYRDQQQSQWWCLLQLEEVIPANPVPLDQVRPVLQQDLQEQAIRRRMAELMESLRRRAKVEIVDPLFQ